LPYDEKTACALITYITVVGLSIPYEKTSFFVVAAGMHANSDPTLVMQAKRVDRHPPMVGFADG